MKKLIFGIAMVVVLSGCSQTTGQNVIKSANAIKALQGLTTAGVNEELTNCVKDIFDPGNRGGC